VRSYVSVALRCTVLLTAFLILLAPAGADVYKRRSKAMDSQPQPPSLSRTPDAATPVPPDRVFDSRRLEGTGTLLLEDIMGLVRQAPRLSDEVASALRESNKASRDIACIGKRIDGGWRYLAGARVQPYICKIGDRWLQIDADPVVRGARGETYVTVSDIAKKNAKAIRESNPRWNWTTTKPREWFLE
jgi:hypothetical protein